MVSESKDAAHPTVLELRVHGINNTTPQDLLDLSPDEVERIAGDALGSFWRPTPASLERRRTGGADSDRRGFVPDGIQREAYSWGGMVRSTPDAAGPGGAVLAGLARVGWALLLPFSIANAAAWSWRLPTDGRTAGLSIRAGVVRLFAALLTLLLVATATSLALDLLALQCYRDGTLQCTVLPHAFAAPAGWSAGRRMALFSLAPIALVVGLWLLSNLSRLRYDVADRYLAARDVSAPAAAAAPAAAPPPAGPLLARPDFWSNRGETHRLSLAHLAAGLGLVSLILSTQDAVDGGGWPGAVLAALSAGLLFAALATAFGTRTMPVETVAGGRARRWHGVLVSLCGGVYALTLVALVAGGPAEDAARAGSALTVSVLALLGLVGLMLLLIVASAFFRRPVRPGQSRRTEAWHGLAPAVFLALALGVGLIWSSLVTVGVADWLNGAAGASALLSDGPTAAAPLLPCQDGCAAPDPLLRVPTIYPWFGGLSLALLALAILPIGAALLRSRTVAARAAAWGQARERADLAASGTDMPVGSVEELTALLGPVRDRKRVTAARLHLVEPVAGIVAAGAFVAVAVTAGLSLAYPFVPQLLPKDAPVAAAFGSAFAASAGGIRAWLDVAMAAWTGIAVLVLAGLALPPGAGRALRPLAIIWDLACFLPRAGHPLGAPCYTERAVPEVSRRMLWWLRQEPGVPSGRANEVVLSAHSMGAVVAVCALFSLSSHREWATLQARVSLLTFGVQLRPYFGRFFPELLGPDALGTTGCLRPRLWAADPWQPDAAAPASPGAGAVPARRWISLWRLTDPLGFPAASNAPTGNAIDRFADEIDTTGYTGAVGTHGEYYRTRQYRVALAELARAADASPTTTG